jgi:hypothetical protein
MEQAAAVVVAATSCRQTRSRWVPSDSSIDAAGANVTGKPGSDDAGGEGMAGDTSGTGGDGGEEEEEDPGEGEE